VQINQSIIFYFEKYIVRNNNKTKPNAQPKNPRIVTAGCLYIDINEILDTIKKHNKKNSDVLCNKSTSARLSKFQFTGH